MATEPFKSIIHTGPVGGRVYESRVMQVVREDCLLSCGTVTVTVTVTVTATVTVTPLCRKNDIQMIYKTNNKFTIRTYIEFTSTF